MRIQYYKTESICSNTLLKIKIETSLEILIKKCLISLMNIIIMENLQAIYLRKVIHHTQKLGILIFKELNKHYSHSLAERIGMLEVKVRKNMNCSNNHLFMRMIK